MTVLSGPPRHGGGRAPSATRPASFVRYLSRHRRRGSGSSISYEARRPGAVVRAGHRARRVAGADRRAAADAADHHPGGRGAAGRGVGGGLAGLLSARSDHRAPRMAGLVAHDTAGSRRAVDPAVLGGAGGCRCSRPDRRRRAGRGGRSTPVGRAGRHCRRNPLRRHGFRARGRRRIAYRCPADDCPAGADGRHSRSAGHRRPLADGAHRASWPTGPVDVRCPDSVLRRWCRFRGARAVAAHPGHRVGQRFRGNGIAGAGGVRTIVGAAGAGGEPGARQPAGRDRVASVGRRRSTGSCVRQSVAAAPPSGRPGEVGTAGNRSVCGLRAVGRNRLGTKRLRRRDLPGRGRRDQRPVRHRAEVRGGTVAGRQVRARPGTEQTHRDDAAVPGRRRLGRRHRTGRPAQRAAVPGGADPRRGSRLGRIPGPAGTRTSRPSPWVRNTRPTSDPGSCADLSGWLDRPFSWRFWSRAPAE